MRLAVAHLLPGQVSPIITETVSDVFQVYQAKRFPGMLSSTMLTKTLALQGLKVSVRNEPRAKSKRTYLEVDASRG